MSTEQINRLVAQAYEAVTAEIKKMEGAGLFAEAVFKDFSPRIIHLVFLVARSARKEPPERLLPLANTCFLMYKAMCILDDTADADKDDSLVAQKGTAISIFAGLSLWAVAQQKLLHFARYEAKLPSSEILDIEFYVNAVMQQTLAGHLLEAGGNCQAGQAGNEANYMRLAALKSAEFLKMVFTLPAIFADANQPEIERYGRIGYQLGLLNQLKNDLDSCFETNPRRNGLQQRQLNLAVAYLLDNPQLPGGPAFEQRWQQTGHPSDAVELRSLLEKAGAFEYSRLVLHWLYNQLKSLLNPGLVTDLEIMQFAEKHTLLTRFKENDKPDKIQN